MLERGVFVFRIPPGTTDSLQPLDVQIFRQYKIFVKRVIEAASYEGTLRVYTNRFGILRMHSVIRNQFQAPEICSSGLGATKIPILMSMKWKILHRLTWLIAFNLTKRDDTSVARLVAILGPSFVARTVVNILSRECLHEDEDRNEQQSYPNATSTTRRPSSPDDDDNSSAGSAVGLAAVGLAAGTCLGAVAGGTAAISTSEAGSAVAAGSAITSARSNMNQNSGGGSMPLLPLTKPVLQRVEIRYPPKSLDYLIRDAYN